MNENSRSDHDTLTIIETKLDLLTAEVKKGNDDIGDRLTILGENKMEKEAFHQWEMSHAKEVTLREDALVKMIAENTDTIKSLQESDEKQSKQLTYIAGGLFVFGIILSIVGPLITQAIGHALHIN